MTLRPGYAIAALVLLLTEAAIALWVDDGFIRPYAGDTLAVMLVHCALRAATDLGARLAALTAFAIAVAIECSQYVHLVDRIGLGQSAIARAILGTGFDPRDFLAYAIGAVLALAVEAVRPWRYASVRQL